jgi:DNA-binding protein HU-beta
MTKADIVEQIAAQTGLTKVETKAVVEGVFSTVMDILANGGRIELRGFGVFNVKSRKSRMARNPRTGTPVALDKRFVPIFKASPEFQGRVDAAMKLPQNAKKAEAASPAPSKAAAKAEPKATKKTKKA